MIKQDDSKNSSSTPRWEIPDAWAKNGRCLACGVAPLQVVHLPDYPDYLLCARCDLSFEVEKAGGKIRIKNCPERLERYESELRNSWVDLTVLKWYIEKTPEPVHNGLKDSAPAPLTNEEVWSRTLSLYRLGNKPKLIELTLIQAGATRAQAEEASARLKVRSAGDANKQGRKFWLFGGLASLAAITILGAWFYTNSRINAQLQQGMKNPSVQSSEPILLFKAAEKLPDWIKPGFLKSPDTHVQYGGGGLSASGCPSSTEAAGRIFGGDPSAWTYDAKTYSWQMMNTGASAAIRIPTGMHAGYLNNQSFNFTSVVGPATIQNVNFVAIICE